MTDERVKALTDFLKNDTDNAQRLFALEPSEALEEINKSGYDFTIDELNEYCDEFKAAVAKGELDPDQLENVSGGVVITTGLIVGLACCFGGGAAVGIAAGAKW